MDFAGIIESLFKLSIHQDQILTIPGFRLYRHDRVGRVGGGVAFYVKSTYLTGIFHPVSLPTESNLEVLWLTYLVGETKFYLAAIYHPPKPCYPTAILLSYIERVTDSIIMGPDLDPVVILAGDCNAIPDTAILSMGFINLVTVPTHMGNKLDRFYITRPAYSSVKVVTSAIDKTLHRAIIASERSSVIIDLNKKRTSHSYRLRSPTNTATFLSSLSLIDWSFIERCDPSPSFPYSHQLLQSTFDQFYLILYTLLNLHFPTKTITITSRDPPFVTPVIKAMLRKRNRYIRANRPEQANSLTKRITILVRAASSRTLAAPRGTRITSKALWSSVNQVLNKPAFNTSSGNSHSSQTTNFQSAKFNEHYAAVSQDPSPGDPLPKHTAFEGLDWPSEYQVFSALDRLSPTAAGIDGIPYWLYKYAAPYISAPLSALYRQTIASSFVPLQWKTALIHPTPKCTNPAVLSDFRPISHTALTSRILERLVVRHFFILSLLTNSNRYTAYYLINTLSDQQGQLLPL